MDLGLFSVSLTVSDLAVSRDSYRKLGFEVTCDELDQGYLILRNGTVVIGALDSFTDVREIQASLRESGIEITVEADESSTGAAHITFEDPDGNPILID